MSNQAKSKREIWIWHRKGGCGGWQWTLAGRVALKSAACGPGEHLLGSLWKEANMLFKHSSMTGEHSDKHMNQWGERRKQSEEHIAAILISLIHVAARFSQRWTDVNKWDFSRWDCRFLVDDRWPFNNPVRVNLLLCLITSAVLLLPPLSHFNLQFGLNVDVTSLWKWRLSHGQFNTLTRRLGLRSEAFSMYCF